jgi:methionyl-tRNA formyltransferase
MQTVSFGNIRTILLFGGSAIMSGVLDAIKDRFKVIVFTSERFLAEASHIEGKSFDQFLQMKGIRYFSADNNAGLHDLEPYINENTLGISISSPIIFKKSFIDSFAGRFINIHGSMLPKFRGGGGVSWDILNGNRKGGFSIHVLTDKIDKGAILYSREIAYDPSYTTPADFESMKVKELTKGLLELINKIENQETFSAAEQDEDASTYFPRLNTVINGYINWDWKLDEIARFVNAFSDPYEGAKSFINGNLVKIKDVDFHSNDGTFHPFCSGLIIRRSENSVSVAAKEGTLVIRKMRDKDNEDFMQKTRPGQRIYTPVQYLEGAMLNRQT